MDIGKYKCLFVILHKKYISFSSFPTHITHSAYNFSSIHNLKSFIYQIKKSQENCMYTMKKCFAMTGNMDEEVDSSLKQLRKQGGMNLFDYMMSL